MSGSAIMYIMRDQHVDLSKMMFADVRNMTSSLCAVCFTNLGTVKPADAECSGDPIYSMRAYYCLAFIQSENRRKNREFSRRFAAHPLPVIDHPW